MTTTSRTSSLLVMVRPNSGISRRSLALSPPPTTTCRNSRIFPCSKSSSASSLLMKTFSSSTTTAGKSWMESIGIGTGTIVISFGALYCYYYHYDALMTPPPSTTRNSSISDDPTYCKYSLRSSSTNSATSSPSPRSVSRDAQRVQKNQQQPQQDTTLLLRQNESITQEVQSHTSTSSPPAMILSTSTSSPLTATPEPSTRSGEQKDEDATVLQMSKAPRLKDKVAIITGASRGIGQAIAIKFVQEGSRVVLLDVADCNETLSIIRQIRGRNNNNNNNEVVAENNDDNVAMYIKCDISDETQVQNAIRRAMERQQQHGNGTGKPRIDVLVNNACCFVFENVEDATVDDWMKSMKVNILGHALVTKHCLPYMKHHAPSSSTSSSESSPKEALLGSGPSIIFQGSISSFIGQPNCATYATMKGAILQMARNCAYDLAKYNIRVNTICAGTIETPISQIERTEHNWTYEQWSKLKTQTTLLQRVGTPMEVANVAVFLANSNESSYITGTHIMVDGGALSCGTVIGN